MGRRLPRVTSLDVASLKAMSKINPNMKGLPESKLFKDYNPGVFVERQLNAVSSYIKPTSRPSRMIRSMPQPARPKPPKKMTKRQYQRYVQREIRKAIRMAQSGMIKS